MATSTRMETQKPSTDAPYTGSSAHAADAAPHDFFAQAQQFWGPFTTSMSDTMTETMHEQRALMERGLEDLTKAQDANLRRAKEATDEMTDMVKTSMSYGGQFTHEWMNLGLCAARRTFEAFSANR